MTANRFSLRPGLYGIVDAVPDIETGRLEPNPVGLAESLLAGGAVALQLRLKDIPEERLLETARLILSLARKARVPFVVNDSLAVALECGADAVHLGQEDLPLDEALARAGGRVFIGVSTHNLEQAVAAAEGGAAYIGFGPVFETATKKKAGPAVGLEELQRVCETVSVPVVAIGGLGPDSAEAVARAGAAAGAVISAVNDAPNVRKAAARFTRSFLAESEARPF
jgi:thiamine-phosphate pyrophosphorylase